MGTNEPEVLDDLGPDPEDRDPVTLTITLAPETIDRIDRFMRQPGWCRANPGREDVLLSIIGIGLNHMDATSDVHRCVRIYLNGDRVSKVVQGHELADWLRYNAEYRPGVAVFVDGECRQEGYLPPDRVAAFEAELKSAIAVVSSRGRR